MDIELLARKLEPLCPQEVATWRKRRHLVAPDIRELMDRRILTLAGNRLGDVRNKILLSLPPPTRIRGRLSLGTVQYEKPKWPAGITHAELLQNLAIFGRSGAGKTNTVFHLLEQLTNQEIPWLFLDWKRTARHLLPRLRTKVSIFTPGRSISPFAFNPFITPPGMERNTYINQIIDVMAAAFTLGDGARSVLQKAISACYDNGQESPTPQAIIEQINEIPDSERVRGWKISALRALESLAFSKVAGATESSQQQQVAAIFEGNTIIELDALSDRMKDFLVPILSLWCYAVKMSSQQREKLSLVVVVEEAHHVLYRSERARETMMERLLRQCREIGIGMIIVDQHPHLISSAAAGNCYTSICMNLKDPSDLTRAAGLSRVPDSEKGLFSMLPCGQGVVKLQDRWRQPFLVQFPHIQVAKGAVTDDLLKKYINGSWSRYQLRRETPVEGDSSHLGTGDRLLTLHEFRLIHDVLQHPESPVRERRVRLGFSGERITQVKEGLLLRGWLLVDHVKEGRQTIQRLSVPPTATALFGADLAEIPPERVVHDYWQRHYAAVFQSLGFTVQLEAERVGGRVDILAEKNEQRIGIEIETGKSDVVANVRNCLRSRFDKVLVVATDEHALRIVERRLAETNLLIAGRVDVFIAGDSRFQLARSNGKAA